MHPSTAQRVADILERLRNGESVQLGDFSDNASPATDADMEAALIDGLIVDLRTETPPPEMVRSQVHPSIANVLRFFEYEHLPPDFRTVSRRFHALAYRLASELDGAELTMALRKLLEAKDAAVRAALPPLD